MRRSIAPGTVAGIERGPATAPPSGGLGDDVAIPRTVDAGPGSAADPGPDSLYAPGPNLGRRRSQQQRPVLTIRQIRTGDEVRRLAVIRRPVNNLALLWPLVAAAIIVGAANGRGGGEDGALGVGVALLVLVGGTVFIQRLGRVRVLIGFNPDGFWSPSSGWVPWTQVRHLELRQTKNPITGRHHTIWLGYQPMAPTTNPADQPDPEDPAPPQRWVGASPGLRQVRALQLLDEMERCWTATSRRAA